MLATSSRATRVRHRALAGALLLALAGAAGCGQLNEKGGSPSYLVIGSLEAASGAKPGDVGNTLQSDVITLVKSTVAGEDTYVATIYEDVGVVTLRAAMKELAGGSSPATPTPANTITVTRYHVEFKRADGRNTPGVDVPYGFDGAATGSFDSGGGSLSFVLVRAQAKAEAPLKALRNGGGAMVISAIAEVTFYGQDQNGNTVSVTGLISVNFADWGDPT